MLQPLVFSAPLRKVPSGPAILSAMVLLVLSGCASLFGGSEGGDDYDIDQGEIARRSLPGTREVDHSPDSLAHLELVTKDGRIDFQLADSYRSMLLEWTVGRQGGVGDYFQTHATLWSKELSLASLMPERGIQTLSEDLAREMIAERTAEYDSLLQIDVYLFAQSVRLRDIGALRLDGAGRRVYLRDEDGRQYEPTRIDSQSPLETFWGSRQTLYGRNAVFFDRYAEDGTDVLDAEQLRLYVRPYNMRFTWDFPDDEAPVAATEER